MINSLRLINFRRHADTQIDFAAEAQIVAISGRNGAGKSTILEAIVYALYGESRHGRRGLGKMVRRSAVHEGMQVELTMTVGDVEYQIQRRYEKGKSSAVLFANGNRAMQSPDGVTAEITRLLGMDVVGFRLAVIAQQFDVDGLADLTPARRRATISRLLRQDAVTTAAKRAREIHQRELDVVRAIGLGPDLEALTEELATAQRDRTQTEAAIADSRMVVDEIDAELAASADVESRWQQAQVDMARADATIETLEGESLRLSRELEQVRMPDAVPAPQQPLAAILEAVSQVNVAIAKGESARDLAAEAAATKADLGRVTARLAALADELGDDTPATIAMQLSEVAGKLAGLTTERDDLDAAREELRVRFGGLEAQVAEVQGRIASSGELGDTCDTCEQEISAAHKHQQQQMRAQRLRDLTAERDRVLAEGTVMRKTLESLAGQVSELAGQRDALQRRRGIVESGLRERRDLEQRRGEYTARLDRIVVDPVDLDALYTRKGLLEVERAQAEQAEQVAAARAASLERREQLREAMSQATTRSEAALQSRLQAEPDADLVAAHERRAQARSRRAEEIELLGALEVQLATAAEQCISAERALSGAQKEREKVAGHRLAADRAAKAAQVLSETAARMATQIRPALEGEISTLLLQLSEGRFTSVRVSDDYEITVEDDGKFEPLSEFSGGESVLIALATRLALANVVAGRHAMGGAGFLILDEVFGSQDAERRQAILSGLRNLRALYGQILLISHVGGFEDAADRVIEVSPAVVDGERSASVSAA